MHGRLASLAGAFALLFFALLGAGVFLGVDERYTHHTIWAGGRILFVPAGIILLGFAGLVWRARHIRAALWMGLVSLALIGAGAHEAFAGPWTVLALPACGAGALGGGRGCVRGNRDAWTAWVADALQTSSRPAKHPVRSARVCLGGLAVLCLIGAVMAASAA